jgi:hypothetical protein
MDARERCVEALASRRVPVRCDDPKLDGGILRNSLSGK